MSVGSELLNAPFPEMVVSLGTGIAEAQFELDKVAMNIATEMASTEITLGSTDFSLLALGFTPTFYQFVDTVIELKMAISMKRDTEATIKGRYGLPWVASVNASYTNKFQYSVEGSSLMRTKLVTVPAPALLEEAIRSEILEA